MASTKLTRTFGSGGSRVKWTWSGWIKRSGLGSAQAMFTAYENSNNHTYFRFDSDDQLRFEDQSSGNTNGRIVSNMQFRDTNAWYHLVAVFDKNNSTSGDRIKMYVNGERITSFSETGNTPFDTSQMNNESLGREHEIGCFNNTNFFDGLMSHIHFCDGYAYQPSDFGSTDSTTGEWKINTSPSVSYGTTGYWILKDGITVTDSSSNSNAWTVGGGTLTKSEDNPSNVFATWNPLWSQSNGNVGDVTFSQGNLTTATSSNYRTTPTTLGMKSGKYYWEIKRNETAAGDTHFGVMSENATPANTATWIGNAANGWIMASNGAVYTGGSSSGILSNGTVGNGAIFMGAYDGATGKLYFGVDGTWAGTANPSTGANPHYTLDTSLFYFPVVSTGDDVSANFGNGYFGTTAVSSAGTNASGNGIFEYNVPTGFTALSTKGLNT